MRINFLLLTLLSSQVFAAENCFLRSYIAHTQSPVREVKFQDPISALTITRVIPKTASPRLAELNDFLATNRIVLVKGPLPAQAGEKTIFLTVSEDALKTEQSLVEHLEKAILEYENAPLNSGRLPAQAQKLVQQMKEKFKTNFINEPVDHGNNYIYENKISIKLRHPDNLRVNAVVMHEITHNTTDRRMFEMLNSNVALDQDLVAREMNFKAKSGKSMNLPGSIDGYNKFYRSDEIEATLREMAQGKKDGLSLETPLKEIDDFIESQEKQLNSLLKNEGADLKISTGYAEPQLGAGRRQRRLVSNDSVDFEIGIIVPKGLTMKEESSFIVNTLKSRIETNKGYRKTIEKFRNI